MTFILFLLLSCIIILRSLLASDLYYEMCGKDVDQFCTKSKSVSDSQDCLRMMRDTISMPCLQYLELDKPSIIESCSQEITKYCNNITPDVDYVNDCLSGVLGEELSSDCQEALLLAHHGREILQSSSVAAHQPGGIWCSCVRYFVKISEGFMAMQIPLTAKNLSPKLRGMQGNIKEGSIFFFDDDNIHRSSPEGTPADGDDDDGEDDNDVEIEIDQSQ
mmetsp:Transcript_26376/g.28778  ORF Transcript_26376/g.28778 Transcript_26376/m.28778 type:complete len:219 (-) Transcript_26376:105-761(-)